MIRGLAILGLASTVVAVDHLPSIKEMLDDWDIRMAAKAAGIKLPPREPLVLDASHLPGASNPKPNERPMEQDQRGRRQTRIGQLQGTFVAECNVSSSWFGGGSFNEVAQAKTTQYNVSSNPRAITDTNGTFEVDYTEYVGGDCDPAGGGYNAKAFAKYNLQGQIAYHGTSTSFPDSYRAEWIIETSDWVFPTDPDTAPTVNRLLSILNEECPCHGNWSAGMENARHITNHNCRRDGINADSFTLCAMIAGLPSYALYRYTNNTQFVQYQSSPIAFTQQAGWYTAPLSRPRSRLAQSDAHFPEDCSFTLPLVCGIKNGVLQNIAQYCDGCTFLECTGCAYRFMERSKNVQVPPQAFWSECCPCSWYMSQHEHAPWMAFPC